MSERIDKRKLTRAVMYEALGEHATPCEKTTAFNKFLDRINNREFDAEETPQTINITNNTDPRTDAIHKYIKEELEPWMNRARVVMESQEDRIKQLAEEIAELKHHDKEQQSIIDRGTIHRLDVLDTRSNAQLKINDLNGNQIGVLEKKIKELEARINKREPRSKPPLCSVPFDRCPYYLKEDDPIQYPCIMCRYFGRLKTTNQ